MIRSVIYVFLLLCGAAAAPGQDIVVADFEVDSYRTWTAEGDAFGTRPAPGTLDGQMPVSQYPGSGLVNSFLDGKQHAKKNESSRILCGRSRCCVGRERTC